MQWYMCYEANFGKKLAQDEIEGLDTEIEARIHNLHPGETLEAVRDMAERIRTGESNTGKFAPTANHIISAIIRLRAEARAARDNTAMPLEQRMAAAKARLRTAADLNSVWNLISAAYQVDVDAGSELETFARELYGPRYTRPTMPAMERITALMVDGLTLREAHTRAWDECNAAQTAAFQGHSAPVAPQPQASAEGEVDGMAEHVADLYDAAAL